MSLLNPASIAVIGASATEGKVGHDVLRNLLTQGFRGAVVPVNPKGGEILGQRVFASVGDIPKPIDLAVIVTPAPTVPLVLEECGTRGIRNAIIISAGFKETGSEEGKSLEEKVRSIAEEHSIDLLGPNCLGMLRPSIRLNASFARTLPPRGNIALISQSGALLVALLDAAHPPLGFSIVLSIGNKTVLDECDFLEHCAEDPETHVIGLYLESIEDGLKFREAATRVTRQKPIVLLKAGVSSLGKRAAVSHTGALAGSDAAIAAVCAQTGIHRANDLEEFTDLLAVLSTQPPLLTPRFAIVTNAGGPGILAVDRTEREKLILPSLTEKVERALRVALPAAASTKNPIDVIGDAGADRYAAALEACSDDPSIDGVIVLLTPQVMTPVTEIARAAIDVARRNPLMPIVASFMGGTSAQEGRAMLHAHGIPSFDTPERAVRALAALKQRWPQPGTAAARDKKDSSTPEFILSSVEGWVQHEERSKSAHTILHGKHGLLPEDAASKLLNLYAIPLPQHLLARNTGEACAFAQRIGYPVIAKVSSPQILHKTDVGGIKGNIETDEDLQRAFEEIMENVAKHAPEATVRGILIQKFLPVGSELIIGGLRDASFGPLVMAGLGGIYTELFRDTAFRLAPLKEEEAYEMLQELKAWKLLLGMRGRPPANMDVLVHTILSVSQMLLECPQIRELDFNPVLLSGNDVTIADAKVIVEGTA